MNPHEASVPLIYRGRTSIVCFDLRAIAAVQAAYGKEHYLARFADVLKYRDAEGIAFLLSVGIKGETVDSINEWSPPLVPSCEAMQVSFLLAMHGPTMTREEAAGGDADPRKAHVITSLKQLLLRFMPASRGPKSGHSPHTPSA